MASEIESGKCSAAWFLAIEVHDTSHLVVALVLSHGAERSGMCSSLPFTYLPREGMTNLHLKPAVHPWKEARQCNVLYYKVLHADGCPTHAS